MGDISALTDEVRSKVGANSGIGATVKFNLGSDGVIYVDGKSTPNSVSNEDKPADCTIKVSKEDYENLNAGKLDPTTAFMQGKIKVEGNMAVAMKLQPIFGR